MLTTDPAAQAAALHALTLTGVLTSATAHPDGSWTVVPADDRPVLLTTAAQVDAYLSRAQEAADRLTQQRDDAACGCMGLVSAPPQYAADLMQARAVAGHLAQFIAAHRRSIGVDEIHQAAAVRVHSDHGLYALLVPPPGRPFPIVRDGRRAGALTARRVPATTDSAIALQFVAFLRDRGDLD